MTITPEARHPVRITATDTALRQRFQAVGG